MKRRYQIEGHRAVQSFRRWAAEKNPNIQMILPLAEVVSLLQDGVGHLLREAGLALMQLVMEEEVRRLAGERQQQHPDRQAHRWGKEAGLGEAAPRADGPEPERRPQSGRRPGGDAHGAPVAGAGEAAPVPGQHECNRVSVLHRRDGLPQREALAPGRSDRTLGGIGTAGGRAAIPPGPRLSGDSAAAGFLGQRGFPKISCHRSRGCIV